MCSGEAKKNCPFSIPVVIRLLLNNRRSGQKEVYLSTAAPGGFLFFNKGRATREHL